MFIGLNTTCTLVYTSITVYVAFVNNNNDKKLGFRRETAQFSTSVSSRQHIV